MLLLGMKCVFSIILILFGLLNVMILLLFVLLFVECGVVIVVLMVEMMVVVVFMYVFFCEWVGLINMLVRLR